MSAISSMNSVPPCASSSAPTLRPRRSPPSTPNSSISIRSGVMVAALMTTNGPPARLDWLWIMRAASSLPEPEGPTMSTRLLVGATRSIALRSWLIAGEAPTSALRDRRHALAAP